LQRGHLLLLGKDAEQERRDGGVERGVREREPRDVHPAQVDLRSDGGAAALGPGEHRGAEVDPDHLGALRIDRDVAPGAHAGVEDPAREAGEELRADAPVAAMLEREVEEVVEARDALVGLEMFRQARLFRAGGRPARRRA
jgi:hypothetical protein